MDQNTIRMNVISMMEGLDHDNLLLIRDSAQNLAESSELVPLQASDTKQEPKDKDEKKK